MFNRKEKSTIDSLIGSSTSIKGNVHFKGGLRIDGHIKGNVIAESGVTSMLVISESAKVEGEVRVAHLVVNGEITGNVYSSELLELQPKARITGDVHYKALEMHSGALVSGKLTHDQGASAASALKLLATTPVSQIEQNKSSLSAFDLGNNAENKLADKTAALNAKPTKTSESA